MWKMTLLVYGGLCGSHCCCRHAADLQVVSRLYFINSSCVVAGCVCRKLCSWRIAGVLLAPCMHSLL